MMDIRGVQYIGRCNKVRVGDPGQIQRYLNNSDFRVKLNNTNIVAECLWLDF